MIAGSTVLITDQITDENSSVQPEYSSLAGMTGSGEPGHKHRWAVGHVYMTTKKTLGYLKKIEQMLLNGILSDGTVGHDVQVKKKGKCEC